MVAEILGSSAWVFPMPKSRYFPLAGRSDMFRPEPRPVTESNTVATAARIGPRKLGSTDQHLLDAIRPAERHDILLPFAR